MSKDEILDTPEPEVKEVQYETLRDFLKIAPRNFWSIVVIWSICIVMITAALIQGSETFDPEWSMYAMIAFLVIVMVMGYLRVYLLYKENKWKRK